MTQLVFMSLIISQGGVVVRAPGASRPPLSFSLTEELKKRKWRFLAAPPLPACKPASAAQVRRPADPTDGRNQVREPIPNGSGSEQRDDCLWWFISPPLKDAETGSRPSRGA